MKNLFLIVGIFLLLSPKNSLSNELGIRVNYGSLFQNTDIRAFETDLNTNPILRNGSGNNFGMNAFFNYGFAKNSLIGFSFGFVAYNANTKLKGEALTTSYESVVSDIHFSPTFAHRIYDNLWVNVGFHLGMVNNGVYSKFNSINGTESKVLVEEIIEDQSTGRTAIQFGFHYNIPVNSDSSAVIAPEIYYQHGISSVVSDRELTFNIINFGISIKYSKPYYDDELKEIEKKMELEEVEPVIVQTKVPKKDSIKKPLKIEVLAKQISETGQKSNVLELNIEEFQNYRVEPLLNYIFFEDNSSEIPKRYKSLNKGNISEFSDKSFSSDSTLEIYYDLLNIIGQRLKNNTEANITLIGTNSNADYEIENINLSKIRANNVKKYLVSNWNINEKKIEIKARNLPEKYSNKDTDEGKQENRRVEIYSDSKKITGIVEIRDTLRIANPPSIIFELKSDLAPVRWGLRAIQDGKILKSFHAEGDMPESLIWNLEDEQKTIPRFDNNIIIELIAQNNDGIVSKDTTILKTNILSISKKKENKMNDKTLTDFNLILFDFNSSRINKNNNKIINLVKDNIKSDSKVYVTGYSDKTGSEELNLKLSKNRAESTSKLLNSNNVFIDARGENNTLFPFDRPEGRMYARTVNILVETPVK